jgi:hypothetical protein
MTCFNVPFLALMLAIFDRERRAFFLKPPLAKQAPLDPHVGWDTRPFVLQLLTLAPQIKSSSVLIVPGFLLLDETLFAINGSRNIRRPA